MSTISPEDKKLITKDWLVEFPELSAYSHNKLYKIVGPLILGLSLLPLPRGGKYRPHLVCFPLWKKEAKDCLIEPLILREISNTRGSQCDIPYAKHGVLIGEAVDCVRKQSFIPFAGDVPIGHFFELTRSEFGQCLVRTSPVGQAKLYEAQFAAALYSGKRELAERVLKEAADVGAKWHPDFFNWKYGSFETWFQGLQRMFDDVESFTAQVDANRKDKKLKRLHVSEFE